VSSLLGRLRGLPGGLRQRAAELREDVGGARSDARDAASTREAEVRAEIDGALGRAPADDQAARNA
jgi:hypothetical protein